MSSIRGEFFKKMMRMQNINPIAHPEMEQKMKRMKERLYARVPVHKERHKVSASPQGEGKAVGQGDILHSRRVLYQRSNV